MERKGKAACILLFIISFPCREEMLPAIRHAKVSAIPGGCFFVVRRKGMSKPPVKLGVDKSHLIEKERTS